MKRMLGSIVSLVVLLCITGSAFGATAYKVTRLGWWYDATSINDVGQILVTGGQGEVSIYQGGSVTQVVNTGATGTAISNNGYVVGRTVNYVGPQAGFIWRDGIITYIDTIEGFDRVAPTSVNDLGQVTGYCNKSTSVTTMIGFGWENGVTTAIDTLNGYACTGSYIDEDGTIYGVNKGAGFMLDNGVLTPLPLRATHVNSSGVIAGSTVTGTEGPAIYDHGELINIGIPFDGASGRCTGINDAGTAVGLYYGGNGTALTSFAYSNGEISILPTLGGGRSTAKCINNAGQIVGWAEDITGRQYAVLWEPVPEPASILALATGLVGIGGAALRRRK